MFRFGTELNLSMASQQRAAQLLAAARRNGLQSIGKDPKGLAAAAIYMATKTTREHKTQTEIAAVARITALAMRIPIEERKQWLKELANGMPALLQTPPSLVAPGLPAGAPVEFYLAAMANEYFAGVVVSIFLRVEHPAVPRPPRVPEWHYGAFLLGRGQFSKNITLGKMEAEF